MNPNRPAPPPESWRGAPPPLAAVAWALLSVHVMAVAVLVGYLVIAIALADPSVPDANIGAGLAALGLAAFGLPWSIPVVAVDRDLWRVLVVTGSALLNLALHAAWAWRRLERYRRGRAT